MFCSATPPPRNVKLCERSSSDADDESRLQRARRQSDGADGTCACVRLCVCVCAQDPSAPRSGSSEGSCASSDAPVELL